jgi:hypothetical protein
MRWYDTYRKCRGRGTCCPARARSSPPIARCDDACRVNVVFLVFSFVFDNYCLIIKNLKKSSHKLYVISYFLSIFNAYICAIKFDVTENLENFVKFVEN